jgi:hypothetical protein
MILLISGLIMRVPIAAFKVWEEVEGMVASGILLASIPMGVKTPERDIGVICAAWDEIQIFFAAGG